MEPKKIIIAEDERPMAQALENKLNHDLSAKGVRAVAVHNGQEVLAELEKEKCDLLLLDIMMPTMDGYAVLSAIKEKNLNIPTIVLSNLGQTEEVNKAKELGAIDFFVKADTPINNIVEKVKSVLNI